MPLLVWLPTIRQLPNEDAVWPTNRQQQLPFICSQANADCVKQAPQHSAPNASHQKGNSHTSSIQTSSIKPPCIDRLPVAEQLLRHRVNPASTQEPPVHKVCLIDQQQPCIQSTDLLLGVGAAKSTHNTLTIVNHARFADAPSRTEMQHLAAHPMPGKRNNQHTPRQGDVQINCEHVL